VTVMFNINNTETGNWLEGNFNWEENKTPEASCLRTEGVGMIFPQRNIEIDVDLDT
jgi:hypothetical protein